MKSLTTLLLLALLISYILCSLTQEEKDAILQTHNNARRNVIPPAKEMPDLVWDSNLEQIAQNWASECKSNDGRMIYHNPNRGYNVGENIAASSGSGRPSMSYLVQLWVNEKEDYDYASNKCAPGRVCGHYTQVVWAKTTKVGCGYAVCNNLYFKQTLVCNYSPAGNYIGQKPYEEAPVPGVSPGISPGVSPGVSPSVSPGVSPKVSPSVSPSTSPKVSPSGSHRIAFSFLVLLLVYLVNL